MQKKELSITNSQITNFRHLLKKYIQEYIGHKYLCVPISYYIRYIYINTSIPGYCFKLSL
jgi:hypothetical protein